MARKYELYEQRRRNGEFGDLMEQTDEDSYDEESDDVKKMKEFSKFNFTGMSFKDYVKGLKSTSLQNEMKKLV